MNIKIAIVVSKFNKLVTKNLLEGAQETLLEAGVSAENITVTWVPGAFELPLVAQKIATLKKADGILCLGCVIRGDTAHFDFVAGEAAKGIAAVAMAHVLPVSFGVLTTDTLEQSLHRAGGKLGNKGAECASALLETITTLHQLEA
jgi:6,7-dimethyl-8-ribityllumazine synthase